MFNKMNLQTINSLSIEDLRDLDILFPLLLEAVQSNTKTLSLIEQDLSSFFAFEKKRSQKLDCSLFKLTSTYHDKIFPYYASFSVKDFVDLLNTRRSTYHSQIRTLTSQIQNDKSVNFPVTLNAIPNVIINKEDGNDLVYDGTNLVSTNGYNPDYSFLGLLNTPYSYSGNSGKFLYWNANSKKVEFIETSVVQTATHSNVVNTENDMKELLTSPSYRNPIFFSTAAEDFVVGEFTELTFNSLDKDREVNLVVAPRPVTLSILFNNCFLNSTIVETDISLESGLSLKMIYSTSLNSYFILNKQLYFVQEV